MYDQANSLLTVCYNLIRANFVCKSIWVTNRCTVVSTHTPSWPSCTCIVYYVYRLYFCTVANGVVDITTVHPQIRDYHKIFRETNQHAPVMLVGVKGTSRLNEYKQFCLDVHVAC